MKAEELQAIRDECASVFIGKKEQRAMDDFESMVLHPTRVRTFELRSPMYVRDLLKHIDSLERRLIKRGR